MYVGVTYIGWSHVQYALVGVVIHLSHTIMLESCLVYDMLESHSMFNNSFIHCTQV